MSPGRGYYFKRHYYAVVPGKVGCPSGNEPTNITSTVLEQEESHTVILLTYEVNGTTFEVTVARTLLWSYEELTDEVNRTASFVSTEITAEDVSMQFYSLSYLVQHVEYNLTVYTHLTPLNLETYNTSFTIISYAPAGKSEVTSFESVEFNSSVTLSQQYAVLGKVAKEVGKIYEKSGNETLAKLAEGYYTMEEEAKGLSKLVEKQLQEYDREILTCTAIIEDARLAVCIFGILETFRLIFYCLQPLAPTWVIVAACCADLYAIFLGVLGVCILSLGIACLIALAAAILLGMVALAGCWGYCPSMQACVNMCFLWWCWDIVCMQMW